MANLAYVRVSTAEQNEQRQTEALNKFKIDKWFIEKVSGKSKNRPELKKCLEYAREGDTIFIHDLSRLARNTKDLLEIIEDLTNRKITLHSNKESIDTSTATGKLFLTMVGAIAEFEHSNLLERQKEGIAIAKKQGKFKGRKAISINKEIWLKHYNDYKTRVINKEQLTKLLGVSRPTTDKLIKEWENKDYKHFN